MSASQLKISLEGGRTMKALQLIGTYLPTTQNWCYRMLKNIPDAELIVVSDKFLNTDTFKLPGAKFIRTTPVVYDPSSPWLVRKALGAVRRLLQPFYDRRLVGYAKNADILHAHFANVGWKYLWLARLTGTPLIISFYGYDYERLPKSDRDWYGRYRTMFEQAALFLAEGEAGRDKLIGMGCPPEKVAVARLGVDTESIAASGRSKTAEELRLVQIASFVEKKGYETTVKAFITAARRCPDMSLTLVGKDQEGLRGRVEKLIDESGVSEKICIIDGIDFSGLHNYLSEFHVLIHPSRHAANGDCEGGAPIVLLDAQATGMPVISTMHCDIPSEVVHGKTGLLSDEDSVEALAGSIERFYRMDGAEYQAFCKAARGHVIENYDAKNCGARLREIYVQCAGSNPNND
jgi:colanic acid/amylovoran biosynthesis glycosyltransferase